MIVIMKRTINRFAFIAITVLTIASCKKTDPYNGHEYVDLGLSVKWATCNVGAEKPEDGGGLFAWGETQPKDKYTWSTYKHCKGSNKTLTKYCFDSSYGTVDNKTVLDKSDDAAHVNWGGKWRTPTHAEFEELYENCTWHTKTVNDVSGYEVKSKINGKSIFLPSLPNPGVGNDESTAFYVDCGFYWFSSLIEDIPGSAYSFFFCTIDSNMDWGTERRYLGMAIRPVCP